MKIHAVSRPLDDYDADPHRWTIESDDYTGEVLEQIREQVPAGHVLLSVRPERDWPPC